MPTIIVDIKEFVELIMLIISGIVSVRKYLKNKRKKEERKNKIKSIFIAILTVFLGLVIPVVCFFNEWEILPAWLIFLVKVISVIIFIGNLGTWIFLGWIVYKLKDIKFPPSIKDKKKSKTREDNTYNSFK